MPYPSLFTPTSLGRLALPNRILMAPLTRCRVDRARQLLLRSPVSLSAVAHEVGFCDQSHLARHFKRVLGVTPAAFVRNVVRRKPVTV